MRINQPHFLTLVVLSLAAGCAPRPRPQSLPSARAPSVEAARIWIETQRLRWPNRIDRERLINVTSSTTPEVAHGATGATCRFWYQNGDIRHVFQDGRHFECSTMLGWVSVNTRIDYRETPDEVRDQPNHYWNYLRRAREDVAAIVSARVDRTMNDRPPGISRTQPVLGSWTAPDGRAFRFATADVIYPSGAPPGSPPRGLRRVTVIAVGEDWIVSYSVNAPIIYRRAIETIHAEGLRRLLASLGRGPVAGQ